ncbi:MAG TPA: flavodoxin family protein [Devosia sp.]|nr:flavodoxin family protein [Devosia sp.]
MILLNGTSANRRDIPPDMSVKEASMSALVVCDSLYGNTATVAEAIASALGQGTALFRTAQLDPADLPEFDLLVVGSPTQGGRPSKAMQEWLREVPRARLAGRRVAAFDTRLDPNAMGGPLRVIVGLVGCAAPRMLQALEAKGGVRAADPEGFIVTDRSGPLRDGEYARATAWAARMRVTEPVA